jgi:hypothetical protein
MFFRSCLPLALFVFVLIQSAAAERVRVIVIGAQSTAVERFAAEELQRYLREMSPTADPVPIRAAEEFSTEVAAGEVLIGRSATNSRLGRVIEAAKFNVDRATLGEDGYLVKTVPAKSGSALLLTGSHDRSALFAVYHFLETCGVRFFGYRARAGEIVPLRATPEFAALDLVEKPRMKYRFVSDNNFSAADKTQLVAVADWAAKNRCNAFTITPSRAGEQWSQIALDEVQKRGLMIVGPGHVLSRLTPDKTLFATHPEFFPLLGGQRKTTYSEAWGGATAFCYSNPTAMQMVMKNALGYLAAHPFINIFALYPPDGSQRGVQCQCPECAKLSASDWYLTIINRLAAALASQGSDRKLMWIAYNECGVPPRQVQPLDHGRNMLLLWCNDVRDHRAPMDSETNRRAASYLAWKPRLKTIKTDGKKNPQDADLAAWSRWRTWAGYLRESEYRGEVVLLDYYNLHVARSLQIPWLGYCQSGPWPGNVMQQDFLTYAAEGIVGWQNCTDYYNDAPNPWWNRLAAQLLWNPQADVPSMRRDFYTQLYGPAGTAMEEYFGALWKEIAAPDISPAAAARLADLEKLLKPAAAIAKQTGNAALSEKLQAALSFHARSVAEKQRVLQHYQMDGSPKRAAE